MLRVVCTAIIRNGKDVLLVFDTSVEKFGLPGGKLEEGETLRECLKRECHEELGAQIDIVGLVAMSEKPNTHEGNTVIRFFYEATITSEPDKGELKSRYFSQKEIVELIKQNKLRGRDVAHLITSKHEPKKYLDEPMIFVNL